MEVILFNNFSKRRNSTKQPNDSDGITINVNLKDRCSMIRPSFFVTNAEAMVYIKAWGYYYFVDNVEWDIYGASYINCTIDVLATFKTAILNTSAFIQYSSSNYDVMVDDIRISQKATRSRLLTPRESLFQSNPINGTYILTIANMTQGVGSWALTWQQYIDVTRALAYAGQNVWESLQKLFGDAMGGLIGARYVPVSPSWWDINPSIIEIGDYTLDIDGQPVYGRYLGDFSKVYQDRTFNIPWPYNDFRRSSKYTRLYFVLPFIGAVDIAPESVLSRDEITMKMVANCATGIINYGIYITDDSTREHLLASYTGQFGRTLPLANAQVDAQGFFNAMVRGTEDLGLALLTEKPKYGLSALNDGISALISANKTDFNVIGGYGGGYGEDIIEDYKLIGVGVDCRTTPSEMTDLYGRPCAKVLQISTLNGYVETKGFSIDIPAQETIKQMINDAMDSGVYLE